MIRKLLRYWYLFLFFKMTLAVIGGYYAYTHNLVSFFSSADAGAREHLENLKNYAPDIPSWSSDDKISAARSGNYSARVVGISDGDTLVVLDSKNIQHRIRLAAIDAPEKTQDFGQKAKENLSRLAAGKTVVVKFFDVDRYGREVALVGPGAINAADLTFAHPQSFNLSQVNAGFAWVYRNYLDHLSESEREQYDAAEKSARKNANGLWSGSAPVEPWNYRRSAKSQK